MQKVLQIYYTFFRILCHKIKSTRYTVIIKMNKNAENNRETVLFFYFFLNIFFKIYLAII